MFSAMKSEAPKCERCWRYVEEVGRDGRYPSVCLRCARMRSRRLGIHRMRRLHERELEWPFDEEWAGDENGCDGRGCW